MTRLDHGPGWIRTNPWLKDWLIVVNNFGRIDVPVCRLWAGYGLGIQNPTYRSAIFKYMYI